jgi:hypothetical protein
VWEADLLIGTAEMTCRLADRPGRADGALVVTALDQPCFGADGAAVPGPGHGQPAWPVQVSA